jgi:SAM-dependent methyltransferase
MPEIASRPLSLDQLHRRYSTEAYTLVVHAGSVQHRRDFPCAFVVSLDEGPFVNLPADHRLEDLALIGSESFGLVVCADVLERVPDPARVIGEIHRILKPGGRLIVSVARDAGSDERDSDVVRLTAEALEKLLREWSTTEIIARSAGPFGLTALGKRVRAFFSVAAAGQTNDRTPALLHRVVTKSTREGTSDDS